MRVVRVVVVVLALVAAGCTGDDGADTPDPPEVAASASDDSVTVSPISERTRAYATVDGEDGEEVVRPGDLLQAVRFGVEDGAWSEAEGIARALDGLVGRDAPVAGLRLGDVGAPALTSLVRRGTELIEQDLAASVHEDLEASLAFFTPTQEVLDRISVLEEEPATAAPAVYRPGRDDRVARQVQSGSCRDVAAQGFQEDLDTGEACYTYRLEVEGGHALRVYYPSEWSEDDTRLDHVGASMDALIATQKRFQDRLTVGDVNVVYSLELAEEDQGVAEALAAGEEEVEVTPAATGRFLPGDACPITIYTPAVSEDLDLHRQAMAHEAFHCIQDRNWTTAPLATHEWWLEGSAEFFSNVVYKDVDLERRVVGGFDQQSTEDDPTQMAYENAVFFQYYSNRTSVDQTLELLEHLSSSGATLESLASVDGMQQLWQDFIVAWMAGQVLDTNGGTWPAGQRVTANRRVTQEKKEEFVPRPLVGSRWRVDYAQEKLFVQSADSPLPHAVVEWDDRQDPAAWTELPEEVRSECENDASYLLVSTVIPSTGSGTGGAGPSPKFVADVTMVEDAECDPCVLGPWELRLATFEAYMSNVFASLGAGGDFGFSLDGHYYAEFDEERGIRSVRQPLVVRMQAQGVSIPPTEITGTETGTYSADGERMTIEGIAGGGEASLGQVSVGFQTDPQSGAAPYTCEDDVLTVDMPDYGPLTFDRIDQIPDPESVEVEPGSPDQG